MEVYNYVPVVDHHYWYTKIHKAKISIVMVRVKNCFFILSWGGIFTSFYVYTYHIKYKYMFMSVNLNKW